ncbi:unnamed protein product, partial [Ectocarpus sp. 8 AP-2014]
YSGSGETNERRQKAAGGENGKRRAVRNLGCLRREVPPARSQLLGSNTLQENTHDGETKSQAWRPAQAAPETVKHVRERASETTGGEVRLPTLKPGLTPKDDETASEPREASCGDDSQDHRTKHKPAFSCMPLGNKESWNTGWA